MPKFVIEREIPGAGKMTDAQARETALKSVEVLKNLGPQIQWLHSYVTEDKVYCVYLAPDEETVRFWHFAGETGRRPVPAAWHKQADIQLLGKS